MSSIMEDSMPMAGLDPKEEGVRILPSEDLKGTICPKCALGKGPPKPLDGGWAWVVLAGAFYVAISLSPLLMCYGIIFVDPLLKMGVSSAVVAWILNSHVFVWHISSIFAGPLAENFGWRPVAFYGYLICAVAFMALTFANSPVLIFLLFSVIIGVSGGISNSIIYLIVPAYFDKLKGMSTAIIMVGISVGMILQPPLVRVLIEQYSFQGCALIFGALLANCCVAAMIFHPLEWHQKDYTKQEYSCHQLKKCSSDCPNYEGVPRESKVKTVLKSTLSHMKQVRQTRLLIITLSFAFFMVGYANLASQIPFALDEEGYERNVASICISVSAVGSAVFRVIVSCTSDRSGFNRKACYLAGSLIAGLSSMAFPMTLHDKQLMYGCMTLWGIGNALPLSVFHALMIDICGRKLFVSGVCLSGFFWAVSSILLGPCIGFIRDISSFWISMPCCGFLQILCGLIWIFMPWAIRRDLKLDENTPQR